MQKNDLIKIKNQVVAVVREAGEAVLEWYQKDDYQVREKSPDSPVTAADLAAEKIILEGLTEFNYGVLSEESADDRSRLKCDRNWIIDPLDGTKDFIDQTGEFSLMVGLVEQGRPVVAVIYQPAEKALYWAVQGEGAFQDQIKNKQKIKLEVDQKEELSQVTILESRNHPSLINKQLIKDLGIGRVQPCGSVGVKAGLIARGEAHLNINTSNKTWEWDVCAADLILQEAGGRMTDLNGQEFIYNKPNPRNLKGYVASNGVIHEQVIEELGELQKKRLR